VTGGGVGGMDIRAGMYHIFLDDWFHVFPRSQFFTIRAENYYANMPSTLNDTFNFLGVPPHSDLSSLAHGNIKHVIKREAMWHKTRTLLEDFYGPFNDKLALLLNDTQYLWR
jgi:N-acetylgalactosamine 4-sulfate 6-O-sulfotransferase